ncbi:hypothetical protein DICPUDRAFT_147875 [Dictyostelium purpureum]|uniref:Uncharacterized protein n=1 Tax=Dictyostelium purpureum TaxID=5786 RepID=F0Z9M8_DICPU|nr:uncharacterized protein DICPUDRAFT_147875 [Dictyostelium purpureum]EGC39327.1 hypothetical protein DICPUDRAFT_147875 [Dictyostelium purpureum]|eukprot:XP_003284115.1 hypothetical protein DICPUDRAFT_147875 [Dictyostelium purpureum]
MSKRKIDCDIKTFVESHHFTKTPKTRISFVDGANLYFKSDVWPFESKQDQIEIKQQHLEQQQQQQQKQKQKQIGFLTETLNKDGVDFNNSLGDAINKLKSAVTNTDNHSLKNEFISRIHTLRNDIDSSSAEKNKPYYVGVAVDEIDILKGLYNDVHGSRLIGLCNGYVDDENIKEEWFTKDYVSANLA